MAELFKHKFNLALIKKLASCLHDSCQKQSLTDKDTFNSEGFVKQASHDLEDLELKARSVQICEALHAYLPTDFVISASIIQMSLANPSQDDTIFHDFQPTGLAGWVLHPVCDYIAQKGMENEAEHMSLAMNLLKACTKRFTAEFAVRPFLDAYPENCLRIFREWALDTDLHVRRLVSEGTRPYLPWGIRLKAFAKDPKPVIDLLEILKYDESEYVRRSVANSLNDIAKDHPDYVAEIAEQWLTEISKNDAKLDHKNRHRMVKHACRTLLKNGHPKVLALFGYPPAQLQTCELSLNSNTVKLASETENILNFRLLINSGSKATAQQALLIDYIVHHQKANGTLSAKVFKWKTATIEAQQTLAFEKNHSFKAITTRKYYPGEHKLEVLINGKIWASKNFTLL
ncbi:DNA alkylation repair protein [Glaciecola petra]|uniref:DNA alkylation repair protein n=1 Tax=Glaciecola petra TaxID=3075602 RepID=A0ABU2ZUV2_9ALTE|nr:DNA alkylation repair protein [Aestuariibacter sp. P117]MDT0596036.1 DNA alkylation repair protein [Aestuariibacter sp. P117]